MENSYNQAYFFNHPGKCDQSQPNGSQQLTPLFNRTNQNWTSNNYDYSYYNNYYSNYYNSAYQNISYPNSSVLYTPSSTSSSSSNNQSFSSSHSTSFETANTSINTQENSFNNCMNSSYCAISNKFINLPSQNIFDDLSLLSAPILDEPNPDNDIPKKVASTSSRTKSSTTNALTRQRNQQLSDHAVEIMNNWFQEHINNPYPQPIEKENLARLGGITVKQVSAWFSNRRNRSQNTKPKRMKRVLQHEINNLFSELNCHQLDKDKIIQRFNSLDYLGNQASNV